MHGLLRSVLLNSTKQYVKIPVEFGRLLNLELLVVWGVNGVCPDEMVELSMLVELPVVELSGADCISFILMFQIIFISWRVGLSLLSPTSSKAKEENPDSNPEESNPSLPTPVFKPTPPVTLR